VWWHRETPLAHTSWWEALLSFEEVCHMQRVLSVELPRHAGARVLVAGWVHRRRLLKSVAFVILRDVSGLAQIVVGEPATRAVEEELPEETVIAVTGQARANPVAPGGVEIVEPSIDALSDPASVPPVELFRPELRAGLSTQLDHAAVALRHPTRRAALRIGAAAVAGFRASLGAQGFTEIHTPKIVESATESGADVFALDYFGRPAYLAQSPQFYKQLMVGVLERVFEAGPAFRAEPHDTVRHLAQYTSLDAEMAFIDDHHDVMAVVRDALAGMLAEVRLRAAGELELLGVTVPTIGPQVPVVHFADAVAEIGRVTGEDLSAEPDLAPAHERWLGEWARREYGSEFLFVTGYPMRKRPFYTRPEPARPEYSNSFDLIFRGTELVTGGQRLHRYRDYLAALAERGQPVAPVQSYVDAFRFGMPPHGGFAIGLERFVALLVGAANVRAVTAFPRDLHRLTP
jgi:nondiscriminating aspartyl-tRNA synthetase